MKKSDKIKLSIAAAAFAIAVVVVWVWWATRPSEEVKEAQEFEQHIASLERSKDRPLKIGVVARTSRSLYWRGVYVGALKAKRDVKKVSVYFTGGHNETDKRVQGSRIMDLYHNGCDLFMVGPLDGKSAAGTISHVVNAGCSAIVIDTPLETDKAIGFLASDHKGAGAKAAEHVGQLLAGKGEVLMLRHLKGSPYGTPREESFLETMKAKYPGVKVVSSDQYAGDTEDTATKTAADVLKKFPKVNGVFCSGEAGAVGMLAALQQAKLAGKVKFVACDPHPKLVDALNKGQVDALVVIDTLTLGYKATMALAGHIRGTPAETTGTIEAILATKENAEEANIKEILSPDPRAYQPRME